MSEISVAICTYRRADLLPTTLGSLAGAQHPAIDWELLIVDNACEDRVKQIVEGFQDQLPIRYVQEQETGIARARNRAASNAKGPVVLFADDDVLFDPQWLVRMADAIHSQPQCAFWGGRIEPVWDGVERPDWFDIDRCPMLGDAIVRYDAGHKPRPWNPNTDPPFYTCNLALRVEAIQQMGMFDVTLGHMGESRGTGEDSWMIKSIARAGGQGWYAADALLHHPVPPQRLTKPYARSFMWRQGRVSVEMLRRQNQALPPQEAGSQPSPPGRLPRWLYLVSAKGLCAGVGQWLGGLVRCDATQRFMGRLMVVFNTSKLCHAVQTAVKRR